MGVYSTGGAYEARRYCPPDGSTPPEELMKRAGIAPLMGLLQREELRTGIPPLMGQISGSVYVSITRGASHTNKTSQTSSLQPGWLSSSSSRPVGLTSSSSSRPVGLSSSSSCPVGLSSSTSCPVGLSSSSSSCPVGLSSCSVELFTETHKR